jgi:phage-related protein
VTNKSRISQLVFGNGQKPFFSCLTPRYQNWYGIDVIDKTKKIIAYFYKLDSGREPVREWLLSLDRNDRQIVGKDIQKVEFGWPIGMPYSRNLEKGLYEVRSNISNGRIARVLFCIQRNEMILLHGFIKKTQATPDREKELARKRMKGVENND